MVEGNRARRRIKIYRVLHVECRYSQETVESKIATRLFFLYQMTIPSLLDFIRRPTSLANSNKLFFMTFNNSLQESLEFKIALDSLSNANSVFVGFRLFS